MKWHKTWWIEPLEPMFGVLITLDFRNFRGLCFLDWHWGSAQGSCQGPNAGPWTPCMQTCGLGALLQHFWCTCDTNIPIAPLLHINQGNHKLYPNSKVLHSPLKDIPTQDGLPEKNHLEKKLLKCFLIVISSLTRHLVFLGLLLTEADCVRSSKRRKLNSLWVGKIPFLKKSWARILN